MGGLVAPGSEVCLRVLPAPGSPQSRQSVDALAGQRSCSSRLQRGRLCSSYKSLEKAVKGRASVLDHDHGDVSPCWQSVACLCRHCQCWSGRPEESQGLLSFSFKNKTMVVVMVEVL